ncbi:MAG: hypothetical protein LBN27_02145 [Prevotellaceae bacterium]|jgi:hypothetical protein|nr:hypothetical protein [Prevotellaceae bacterium]
MLTFQTAPVAEAKIFTGDIGDIVIGTDSDLTVSITVFDKDAATGTQVLNEKYTPVQNKVTLFDIASVLEQYYAPQWLFAWFNVCKRVVISLSNAGGTGSRQFYAILGKGIRGAINGRFLTLLNRKTTFAGALETLSFNLKDIASYKINVVRKNGTVETSENAYNSDFWFHWLISPVFGIANPETVAEVVVWVTRTDGRYFEFIYTIDHRAIAPRDIKTFLFLNRFGVYETAHLYGAQSIEWDRSGRELVVMIDGRRVPVGDSEQFFTLNTGIQPSNEQAYWLADLFDAKNVWLILDPAKGISIDNIVPMVFDSIETKYNPREATTRNFTVKCMFADRRQNQNLVFNDETRLPVGEAIFDNNRVVITDTHDNPVIINP